MFTTEMYMNRAVESAEIGRAFARAFHVAAGRAAVVNDEDIEEVARAWDKPATEILLRLSRMRGDFPQVVGLMLRGEMPDDYQQRLARVAAFLRVGILTDELIVDPYSDTEWLLITPDGRSTVVYADAEEFGADDPAIILIGDSRRILHELQIEAPLAG